MIIDSLKAAAKKMMIDFEDVTSKIQHNGEKGTCREEVLTSYLRKYIPNKYEMGRGVIIDSDGTQSRQQDFIIYDSFSSPVLLNMDSVKIIPIESIYSIIEVKSSLNKPKLLECVQNIQSVRKLPKNSITNFTSPTAGFVFAYTSETSLDSLLDNLIEFNKDISYKHQISIICVLDKGLIINVSKGNLRQLIMLPNENTTLAVIENPIENNLILFYLFIMQYLNHVLVSPPDLIKYAEKEALTKLSFKIPKGHIPNNSFFEMNGRKVSMDDVKILNSYRDELVFISTGKADSKRIMEFLCNFFSVYNRFAEESMGIKNSTLNFYGKIIELEVLIKIIDIHKKMANGTEISKAENDFYISIETEIFEQYKQNFLHLNKD